MKSKKIFKVFIIIVVVIITTAGAVGIVSGIGADKIKAYFSVFSFPDDFDGIQPFSSYNYEQLNDVEKQAYICILNNIDSHPELIKIPNLTKEEFNNVYFAVKNDNPQILCFSDSCNMLSFWSSAFIELKYEYSVDECDAMQNKLMAEVDRIISEMPEYEDDYSKELYIHDYIVNMCKYEESDHSSNAYGCLIENKAVCSGFSRAAMLLLENVGIKTVLIGGTGISSTQGRISHMWNIVQIEEAYYHLDVTWDNPGNDESISHLYFNLTDSEISLDHTDYDFAYSCNEDKFNYFKYNGLLFSNYGKTELNTIKEKFLSNIDNGINYLEIKFDSADSYNSASDAIIDGVSPNSDMYKIISYISDNTDEKVDISHVNFSSDDNKKYIRLMFDWN